MPHSFNCPNCSAPLDVDGDGSATLRCPYCHASVITPEELRVSKSGMQSTKPYFNTMNPPDQVDLDERLKSICELAIAGDQIAAIRLLRETYVIGLSKAKELVEALQRGEEVDMSHFELFAPTKVQSISLDPSKMNKLMELVRSGDRIEAIKLFRETTGVGLKDAKDAIDGLDLAISTTPTEFGSDTSPDNFFAETKRSVSPTAKASKGGGNCLITGFIIFIVLLTIIPILVGMTSSGGPLAGFWARINPFAAGNTTLQFGKQGTGPGYFTDARFVSVDNNGHIFVGEYEGGRVQVFDEKGSYITQWKATGEESGDIYMTGMTADRNGAVYTVVGGLLYVYDGLTGNLLGRFDHPDGWGFDDVTATPDGSVLAAWYKNRDDLIRFDRNGQISLLLENAIGNVTDDLEMEMKVAADGTGNIYILAYFNEGVFVFAPDGKYISRFGSRGDAKGQFTSPSAISVDNLGKIYIADFPGVMIFASDGRYLDTLPVDGGVMGMTFDDQNNLYVVANEQVLRFKLK
jgi:ribosomal protein L7/L12/sugar lactone lactonase YvrE